MKLLNSVFLISSFLTSALAETHNLKWNATYVTANPDGLAEVDDVISCNGVYPWPDLRVKKGDRVVIELYNGLGDSDTSVHFHGLFQWDTNQSDGVPGLTQCQIPPGHSMVYNFTVPDQVGTFWYHSHTKGQYMDGMRGVFVIEDPEDPYADLYEEEQIIAVSEWYHKNITDLTKTFLNLYNPTGAEPIPQNLLFNNYMNGTWNVKPDTSYLVRLVNTGGFVSQYIYLEDHNMTVVAIDGIYVEPYETDMIYITVAQRYDFIVHTKNDTSKNYAFMQKYDDTMLDLIPDDLLLNITSNINYNSENGWPEQYYVDELDPLDDFYLTPYNHTQFQDYDDVDHQITIDVDMINMGNGINYAFFNNITYVGPKIPTLGTVMSAEDDATALSAEIYGSNTHSIVLQKDEIVEVVLNNLDTGVHPFHLHGHFFQVYERGPDYSEADAPVLYNSSIPYTPREHSAFRDTLYVRPQSYFVIRFKADNPGVWFFHCHIEWHLIQGLALTFVEDPVGMRATQEPFSDSWKEVCDAQGGYVGNAANNTANFFDLKGEDVQPKPLPSGFTARGIVALVFSCISGILGCIAICIYGMADIPNNEERVMQDLNIDERKLLAQLDAEENNEEQGSSGRYSDDNGKRYSDEAITTSRKYSDDNENADSYSDNIVVNNQNITDEKA